MITRVWYGDTLAAQAEAYLEYLNQTGVPAVRHYQVLVKP